jgi:hypothetical protein
MKPVADVSDDPVGKFHRMIMQTQPMEHAQEIGHRVQVVGGKKIHDNAAPLWVCHRLRTIVFLALVVSGPGSWQGRMYGRRAGS